MSDANINTTITWVNFQKALQNWVENGTGLPDAKVYWGDQDGPKQPEPSVQMRLTIFRTPGDMWVDVEENPLEFDDLAITEVDDTTDALTCVDHGLLTGDGPGHLDSDGDQPGGTEADTDYWVIKVDDDTFKIAASFADAMADTPVPVDITDAGSGDITFSATADSLRVGEEIKHVARGICAMRLTLTCMANPRTGGTGPDMAVAILQRVVNRAALPSQRAILRAVKTAVSQTRQVVAIHGVRDAVLFEPRALMDVWLNVAMEETELSHIIQAAEITDETRGVTFEVDAR